MYSLPALARRVGQALVVLWAAFSLAFILLSALPGDAVQARYEDPSLGLNAEQISQMREVFGEDEPVLLRYARSLGGFITGDFGYSVSSGTSVAELIGQALPSTLALALTAFVLGVLLAGAVAITASFGPFSWLRALFRAAPPLLVSLPSFWLGILLIQVFSFRLGWVPVIDASSVQALILPALTLAVPVAAPLAQVLLRSMDEVLEQPFIHTVRARGASPRWLLWRVVLRNALLPAVTMAGVLFGELVGGSVVTEQVFARNGIGALTLSAVAERDTAVLMAVVVIAAAAFVLINLVVDLLYPVLDPRLRRAKKGTPTQPQEAQA
ncbi:ABC transporter permease [Corynebacterium lowii]|uniref:Glutathione transport system permease protein GsiC n=1 Tax=Corynebacterium lowii TaxID=1544413 RepID=A0A0Q1ADL8_9CORY|nr:ABC transporter permease [Corynebacterium lowii]KQB84765.1 Glutathione transport system permease protein GsiC [Corynebacterium lowii]MDP9851668.1 peptide/nickel transport system permease protein [Corynebacterium lowii]